MPILRGKAIPVATLGYTTINHGRKTVASAGTAVALAASTACKWVAITALLTNTQPVAIGGSGVLATSGSRTGVVLNPGEAWEFPIDNLSKVFVDAGVNGEGVSFAYLS